MKWKKFKKERISLDYTVMLVPHSQKKPIHFKTPVWTFGVIFLGLLVLTGTCLFFAGSRHQLTQVRREKEQLEQEWERLAEQKQLADQENEILRQEQQIQKQELEELEERTKNTLKELEDLVEREGQIRQELGLEDIRPDEAGDVDGSDGAGSADSLAGDADSLDGRAGDMDSPDGAGAGDGDSLDTAGNGDPDTSAAANGRIQIASTDLPLVLAKNTADFRAIQEELGTLQNLLSEKTGQYEGYLTTIEEKRAAAAAEKARKEALRASIVTSASSYIGNSYVYGGNDPNTGVDCSGFTRYILGHTAGVYLNRTAAEQSGQGRSVSIEEARPGDLVFYSNGSSINHVAIYVGNGQVVHASNERVGIVRSDMYYRTPVKIKNVLGD